MSESKVAITVQNPSEVATDNKSVGNNMKYVSLACLTLQNAILSLSMRYSRIRSSDLFYEGTAVLMAEVVKCLTCCYLVFRDEGYSWQRLKDQLHLHLIINKMDTLKVCIPSFIYLIQNNCLYVAAEHLDTATYQITYQLKILTTALFAVLILKKTLIKVSLFLIGWRNFGVI